MPAGDAPGYYASHSRALTRLFSQCMSVADNAYDDFALVEMITAGMPASSENTISHIHGL